MFTVLIAEQEHIDAICRENRLFFEPFLDSKDLALCCWNPKGQSLEESVPGLLDAVDRRRNWRVVILNHCDAATLKSQNPFDVVEHSSLDGLLEPSHQLQPEETLEQWETSWNRYYETLAHEKECIYKKAMDLPLQKLATWLCFRPEDYIHNDIQEKQDVHDWAMEMIGRDANKLSVKLEFMEKEQYKRELRLKEKIRRSFLGGMCLKICYPSEVYCISLRSAETSYFNPDTFWNIRQESQYSTFADRNMYFDRMRFMVFDILSPSHRYFRSDYIRFLASVLVVCSNPIPSSAMQARRLYRMDVETDDKPLCILVTSYDKKLSSTYDSIENEMEKIRNDIPSELTDKAAEELFCTSKDVPVVLDGECTSDRIYAEKDYGFFFDYPENEQQKWERDYHASKKAVDYMIKQQLRSVRKSVHQMRMLSEVSDVNISRLTPIQLGDVCEYTNAMEDAMIASIPSGSNDITMYHKSLTDASEKVKKQFERRMTCKMTVMLGGLCLALFSICFFPFFLLNGGTTKGVTTAIILYLISLGLLIGILVISVLCMRFSVVDAIKDYNNTVKSITNDVHISAKKISKYLTATCNVRRGYAIQNYAEKNLDEYTKSLRIRKKHQEEIRKKRAYLAENYGDYLADQMFCDETMSRSYEYDFEQAMEYSYPAPFLAGDRRKIEFISSGNFVAVPSSYVKHIFVRMEGMYEE